MVRTGMLLALVASTTAMGAPNAADAYRELLAEYEAIPTHQRDALQSMPPYLEPCDPTLLSRIQSIEDRLHRASRSKVSDFELDFSQGPELLMPHLGPMRGMARHMTTEARQRTLAGDGQGAARLVDTLNRMAMHLAQDRLLISSLVGMAMLRESFEAIDFMIEQEQLTPRDAAMLLSGFKGIDDRDLMGFVTALDHEQQYMGDWIRAQLDSNGGEKAKELLESFGQDGDPSIELADLVDVDGYDRAMRDMIEAMSMDDLDAASKRVDAIEARLQAGDYGALAPLLTVSVNNMLVMQSELEAEIAWLRAGLQQIAAGEAVEDVDPNAAWKYIERARAIDATAQTEDVDEAARTALLDELMLTALMERYEFPIDELAPRPVVPAWTTGLHRGGRWLVEDARRRYEGADVDGAVGRLDTTIAMAADLSTSPHLADALVAHEMTAAAMKLVVELDELELLDEAARRRLLVTLRDIKASDPFGYRQSADASRRLLELWCSDSERSTMIESLPVDGDGMLFAIAFHEMNIDPDAPPAHCWPLQVDVAALDGLIDPAGIAEARQQGRDAVEAAQVGVVLVMEPAPGIVPGTIERRRADAAEQLRQWKQRLGN